MLIFACDPLLLESETSKWKWRKMQIFQRKKMCSVCTVHLYVPVDTHHTLRWETRNVNCLFTRVHINICLLYHHYDITNCYLLKSILKKGQTLCFSSAHKWICHALSFFFFVNTTKTEKVFLLILCSHIFCDIFSFHVFSGLNGFGTDCFSLNKNLSQISTVCWFNTAWFLHENDKHCSHMTVRGRQMLFKMKCWI